MSARGTHPTRHREGLSASLALAAGHRRVELAIVAAPMSASPEHTTRALEGLVRAPLE